VSAATATRLASVWRQAGFEGDVKRVYEELVAHYLEPHRSYHALHHVSDLLIEFDIVRALAREPLSIELTIWFHDAIYDTHTADNEQKSADLAKQRIVGAGGKPALAEAVATLIMATKTHDPAIHTDAPLLVDLDLSILGQSTERFDEYECQIRREYDWVPIAIFKSKRAEILQRFLARPRIYSTDHFFTKYEQPARLNLQRSIGRLELMPGC
jgi:predicted metal-dependent HD superfamily phosphohydrolase